MASKSTLITSSLVRSTAKPPTQCLYCYHYQARQFSQTRVLLDSLAYRRPTRRRRMLLAWLHGPGKVFRDPPGAVSREELVKGNVDPSAIKPGTNYLTAYNQEGQPNRGGRNREAGDAPDLSKMAKGQEGRLPGEKDPETEDSLDLDPEEMERKEAEAESRDKAANRRRDGPRPAQGADVRPFPLNRNFLSESVLSEEFREAIYLKVVEEKMTVRSVSAESGVTMERVGAVVRMKQLERDWLRDGKPLAVPYSRAVLAMLPQTPYVDPKNPPVRKDGSLKPTPVHESINDLPVHPHTTQQIFYPVSESRAFTRVDAGKAFHPKLRSADARIPHPELIDIERVKDNMTSPELAKYKQDLIDQEQALVLRKAKDEIRQEKEIAKVYAGQRWDFRFQDISVDTVGKDGRSRSGVGWRYGMPHEDRKPGQVKIPTSVA